MSDLVEFRHLKYIAAIAETANFTRAAERLFLAQPSLSKQIKDLEDGIGIQIFVRHHDGVRITAAGQMVVSYAIEAVKARNEIIMAARAVHSGEIPALRIGFSCFVQQEILRSLSDAYSSLFPEYRIQFAGGDPAPILRRMEEKNLDAAVLPLPVSGSDWAIERIASAPLVACMRADDPLAQQTEVQPPELGKRLKIFRNPRPCSAAHLTRYNPIVLLKGAGIVMPIQPTAKIWHNGNLIPWDRAQIHVMSHVVHYGSSVFEGVRCYAQPEGAAVFRLPEHMQRLLDSARIYRMALPWSLDQLCSAVVELVEANGVAPCYIRPIALRGYGEVGVNPKGTPIELYIANYPWGKYVAGDAADVCISSWNRLAPNTMPSLAKTGANYANSQLIRMEADINGYVEGIALDVNGYLSEGSGENVFLVRNGVLYTTPLANSVLSGITRDSILTLARHFGIPVVEQAVPREMIYIADEVFFTGTAAEVTPIRSVDRIVVADGNPGPITRQLRDEYLGIANGLKPDRFGWLTPVRVTAEQPVTA